MPTWGKTQRCLRRWLVICFKKFFIDKILVTQKRVFKKIFFFHFPTEETPTCYRGKIGGGCFPFKSPKGLSKARPGATKTEPTRIGTTQTLSVAELWLNCRIGVWLNDVTVSHPFGSSNLLCEPRESFPRCSELSSWTTRFSWRLRI